MNGFALSPGVGSWPTPDEFSSDDGGTGGVDKTFVTDPNALSGGGDFEDVACGTLVEFSPFSESRVVAEKSSRRALTLIFPSALASFCTHSSSRALRFAEHRIVGEDCLPHTSLHQSSTSLFGRSHPTDSRAIRWNSSMLAPSVHGRSFGRWYLVTRGNRSS